MVKVLTDAEVKRMTAERGTSDWREVADGGCRGLRLRISPTGEKVWALKLTVNGNRVRHTLGAYPAMSLSDARTKVREYSAEARSGVAPAEMDARLKAEKMTVVDAHKEYVGMMRGSLRESTVGLKESMFATHIEPAIGKRMIRTIRKADVIEVVAAVTSKGFQVQANRVYSELMALLRWCEHMSYIDGVPSVRKKDMRTVAGAAKEQARGRTLTEGELTAAWKAAAGLGDLTGDFLRLLMLTGQRRDEVRLMEWGEIDLESGLWTIPAAKYKTGINHCVPLSPQALAIVKARWTKGATGYVLPGRTKGKPFNGALSALRRLRTAVKGNGDFTLHDLRRTVRTGLSRLGVDEATAEMVIGHVPQGIVKVYDQHGRMEERKDALTRWADYLDRLSQGGNVVVLAKKA